MNKVSNFINVSFVVILQYSYVRFCYWRQLGEDYIGSLLFLTNPCDYNDLKIEIKKKVPSALKKETS